MASVAMDGVAEISIAHRGADNGHIL